MEYFENLPIVDYGSDKIRDIFKKIVIENDTTDDWYEIYEMKDNDTLESISYRKYGSERYWWILALLNGFQDTHYDIPTHDGILLNLARDLQVLTFTNTEDYIMFPIPTNIFYVSGGETISGEILRKYNENNSFYVDVRLDDPNKKFEHNVTISTTSSRLNRITYGGTDAKSLSAQIGKYFRQDYIDPDNNDTIKDFARAMIVKYINNEDSTHEIYVKKTNDNPFYPHNTSLIVNGSNCLATTLSLVADTVSDIGTLISYSTVTDFKLMYTTSTLVDIGDVYYNLFMERYDALEVINNEKRIIRIFKPEYKNKIFNLITQSLE